MLQRESYWDKSLRSGRWLWKMRDADELTYMFTLEYLLFIHCMYVHRVCVGVIDALFAKTHHECSKGKRSIMFAVVSMPPGEVPVSPCCKSCRNSFCTLQQPLHWTRTPLTLPLSGLNIHLDQQSQSTFQRNIAAVWARLSVIFTPDFGLQTSWPLPVCPAHSRLVW